MTEVIRWSDRDDLVVFVTGEERVPTSKSVLGLDARRGAVASLINVSRLPRDSVKAFLRYVVKREPVAEELSPKSIAALVYLAELYGKNDLLRQINESLFRAAAKDSRALCVSYVIASTCNLQVKPQLTKRVATRFDQLIRLLKEVVNEADMLLPVFERCDLAIDSEKSLVFFLVDWASLHEATVEQCSKLLSTTRRSFMSPEDLDALSTYVHKFGTSEVQLAWEDYLVDTHLSVCWDTKHIAAKLPRCGVGKYRTSIPDPNRRSQAKSISWSTPLETGSSAPAAAKSSISLVRRSPRRQDRGAGALVRHPKASIVKVAIRRGLLKLREKFGTKSQR